MSNIVEYAVTEYTIYSPFEIQEGMLEGQEVGQYISVDTDLLPDELKGDDALVCDALYRWFNTFGVCRKPVWVV